MARPPKSLFDERPPSAASRGPSPEISLAAIRSLEAADLALADLANLDATEARIQAECDTALAIERERFAAAMTIVCHGSAVKIADRRSQIEKALEEFAQREGAKIFPAGARSIKLSNGEFGFRVGNAKLEPIEGGAPKSYANALDSILALLRKTLGKFKTLFAAGDAQFLKLQIVLDKPALIRAAKEKEITKAELAKVGFEFRLPADAFFAKPKAREVSSQPASPPA